jgi:hypothetical protein
LPDLTLKPARTKIQWRIRVKEETAVLDPVTQDNCNVTTQNPAAYRTGERKIPRGAANSAKDNSGGSVKRFFVNLGRAIERAMDRNHEFDHW